MNWEKIDNDPSYSRTRVPWGWLVQHQADVMTPMHTGYAHPEMMTGYEWRTSIAFVFDPFHRWKVKKSA